MAKPQTGLGGEQPARRRLQPGRREHPLPLQQLGAAAGPAARPRARDSTDGWPWKRGWRTSSPRSWRTAPTAEEERCCRRSPNFRCAAATSTIWRPTSRQPAPPVYNRIGNDTEQIAFFGESGDRIARRSAAAARFAGPEMRRLAGEAALLVRETRFADVNRVAGPSAPDANALVGEAGRDAGGGRGRCAC